MVYLLFSILCSVSIPVAFKLFEKHNIPLIYPILINYVTAAIVGFSLIGFNSQRIALSTPENWYPVAIVVGILLIVMFFAIGYATQKIGIAVTTLSNKLSVVIPIGFSLFYDANDQLIPIKGIILILAIFALFLSIYKPFQLKTSFLFWLPFLLFAGLGIIDSVIKYAQTNYIATPEGSAIFSAFAFAVAGMAGFMFLFFKGESLFDMIRIKYFVGGIILGLANFGSMYFFINALNEFPANNSMVFGANNIGVVILSVFIAKVVFKEALSKINIAGICLAIISISLIFLSI